MQHGGGACVFFRLSVLKPLLKPLVEAGAFVRQKKSRRQKSGNGTLTE
jgi:hypothetical protein